MDQGVVIRQPDLLAVPPGGRTALPVRGRADVVRHPAWDAARAEVLDEVRIAAAVIVLTGPPGTGKSWMIRELGVALSREGYSVTMPLNIAGAPVRDDDAAGAFPGSRRIVLMDEADRLDVEGLRALLGDDADSIVLAGVGLSPEQWSALPTDASRVSLMPLAPQDAGRFVADLMRARGRPADALSPGAMTRLAEISEGLPRLLTTLLNGSEWVARLEGSERIAERHVRRAASLRWEGSAGTSAPGDSRASGGQRAPEPAIGADASSPVDPGMPEDASPTDAPVSLPDAALQTTEGSRHGPAIATRPPRRHRVLAYAVATACMLPFAAWIATEVLRPAPYDRASYDRHLTRAPDAPDSRDPSQATSASARPAVESLADGVEAPDAGRVASSADLPGAVSPMPVPELAEVAAPPPPGPAVTGAGAITPSERDAATMGGETIGTPVVIAVQLPEAGTARYLPREAPGSAPARPGADGPPPPRPLPVPVSPAPRPLVPEPVALAALAQVPPPPPRHDPSAATEAALPSPPPLPPDDGRLRGQGIVPGFAEGSSPALPPISAPIAGPPVSPYAGQPSVGPLGATPEAASVPQARRVAPASPRALVRSETGTEPALSAAQRCRAITLRFQLGQEPSDADRDFLRRGCR